jgi:hypothetical protein
MNKLTITLLFVATLINSAETSEHNIINQDHDSNHINTNTQSYTPSYAGIGGITLYVAGTGLIIGSLAYLNNNRDKDFVMPAISAEFGVLLQALSPIASCMGESNNKIYENNGIKPENIGLAWKIYSLSGLIAIGTLCFSASDYATTKDRVIGITGATLCEACWITCHYLSVKSIVKVKNKKRFALNNLKIYPIISIHSHFGMAMNLSF